MSIFDRDYEEVGSLDKGLILKTAGKIKILWGKKFIDLLDSDGNINVKVKSLIQEEQSKEDIKLDGFYLIDGNLVAKFGDLVLELTSKTDVSFVSFLVEQAASSSEKYTALQNIGFLYKNLEDVNVYPTNGIIYVEESLTLFIIKDGVLSKYYASIPNPYTELFVIAKEDSSEGALVILGEGSQNSLKFDSLKIYSNYNLAVLEANTGFLFNLSNMKVATINLSGLSVDRVLSIGASDLTGYRLYKSGNSSTLEVGNIQAREDIETNRVHSPNSTNTYGFDLYQDDNESYLKVDNVEARKEVKTDKVYSSDSTNGFILELVTENNVISSSLIANLIKARTEVESDSVHSSNFSNNSGYSLEESVGGSLLTIDNIIAREDVQTESIHSNNANSDTGYRIYENNNNEFVLDIDRINERIIDEYYDDELYSDRYIITKFDIGANGIEFETNPNVTLVENDIVEIPIRAIYNNVEDIYRLRFTVNSSGNLTTQEVLSNYTFFEEKPFLKRSLYVVNTSGLKIDFKSFNALDSIKLLAGDISQYSGINNDIGLYSSNNVFLGGLFRKPFLIHDLETDTDVDPPVNWKYFPRYSLDLYNYLPLEIDDTIILPIGKIKELIYNPIEDVTINNKTSFNSSFLYYLVDCDSFYDGKIINFKTNGVLIYDTPVRIRFKIGENSLGNIYTDPYTIYTNNNEEASESDLLIPTLLLFKKGINENPDIVQYFSSSSSSNYSIDNIIQLINNLLLVTSNANNWNSAATFVLSITNTPDADSVINKWLEILDFFDTYTETDTLANLLANKLSLTGGQLTGDLSTSGNITATSFIKTNGTSNLFLKADGSVDSNTYVTTNTALEITGNKTFKGSQVLDFKLSSSTDKPSFTVYNSSSKEIGCFLFRPDSVNGAALMYLGHYNANPTIVNQTYVGFRNYTAGNSSLGYPTTAAYNLVSPLPRDALATFSLTATYLTFYLPLGFTDGTTMVKTSSAGVVDISTLLPTPFSGDYNDLTNKPTIPTTLSQLSDDSTHRLVTDTEKTIWNNKGTYSKPSGGIPETDLSSSVLTSLGKADTALLSYTETDPVFSASAAANITSSDIANWNLLIQTVEDNELIVASALNSLNSDISFALNLTNYINYTYSSLTNRVANTILAAPNGNNGPATFRTLVAADIPDLSGTYLPLSGGTINNTGFAPLVIERKNATTTAGIAFKNSNGILGYIGMAGAANTGLLRWNAAASTSYVILDAGNYTSYTYSSTASRTANTVLAAPNGSNGAATFRALVAADLPNLGSVYKKRINANSKTTAYPDGMGTAGWYRILDVTAYPKVFLITFGGTFNNARPTAATFLVSITYNDVRINQIGSISNVGWVQELRAVTHDTYKHYIDFRYKAEGATTTTKQNEIWYEVTPLDYHGTSYITQVDFTLITGTVTAEASCITSTNVRADQLTTARTIWGQSFDGTGNVTGDLTTSSDIFITGANNLTFGFKHSQNNTNIDIGWDWTNRSGSGAFFRSINGTDRQGGFGFYARNATQSVDFVGLPDGTLTWGNNAIIHAGNYDSYALPLSGGKMTGPLAWNDATALPNNTSPAYVLTIETFASGGKTYYSSIAQLKTAIGLSNYLPLTGGTLSHASSYALVLDNTTTNATSEYIYYRCNGTTKAATGYLSGFSFIDNETNTSSKAAIGVLDNGTPVYRTSVGSTSGQQTLLHTGNYTTSLDTRYVKQADVGNIVGLFTGTCTSAADAQAKVATVGSNFSLVDGVTVAIKFTNSNTFSATASAVITLNVNNTGAKQIWYAASKANTGTNTAVYGYASRYITYMYDATNDVWVWVNMGWENDTNTLIRVYRQTTGYNVDYPILVSRTATIGTAGTNNSNSAVYGVVFDSNQPTVNPNSGKMKVKALAVNGVDITSNSDERLKDIQGNVSLSIEDIANAPSILYKRRDSNDEKVHLGSIALYWERVIPSSVLEDNDGYKILNYKELALACSTQEAKEIVKLKEEIKDLKKEIEILKNM